MARPWQIRILAEHTQVFETELTGSAEIGRQDIGEPEPFSYLTQSGHTRIIVARLDDVGVSRKLFRVDPLEGNRICLTNLSKKLPLILSDGSIVDMGASTTRALPMDVLIDHLTIRMRELEPDTSEYHSLQRTPMPTIAMTSPFPSLRLGEAQTVDIESVMVWLKAAMDVLHSACNSSEFFDGATRAVVNLVGLDTGRVLLREGNEWREQSLYTAPHVGESIQWDPSHAVLDRVLNEKATIWQVPKLLDQESSLRGISTIVAAPIVDRAGEVIGVLYGDRRAVSIVRTGSAITRVDAMLVELFAGAVAAGLARLEQEKRAMRARIQFEQFFTPELSRQLETQPDLLEGRDAEVSVLFCDVQGFSRISGRLGPKTIVEWIGDIMDTMSACVLEHQGVIVDFLGDELIAMWGAPEKTPDHAERACRSALAMLNQLEGLNKRWMDTLKEPTNVGIGVNSGIARVGNVGSHRKFKYGPLGNAVNVAARVQGVTKYLKSRIVITGHVQEKLEGEFSRRRLCRAKLVNIDEVVDLYELMEPGRPHSSELIQEYEQALGDFEKGAFEAAARQLGTMLQKHAMDGPSLLLMSRVVTYLVEQPGELDPVWRAPGK